MAKLQKSEVWINRTKSGNGFTIRTPDETFYTGSIEQLGKFVNGDINGVNLSVIPKE